MLRDILLNLLLNACQSGTKVPVEVRVTQDAGSCAIEVADRGTGSAAEDSMDPEPPAFQKPRRLAALPPGFSSGSLVGVLTEVWRPAALPSSAAPPAPAAAASCR